MADTKQVIDILGIIVNGLKTGKSIYNDTACVWLEEAIKHLKEYQKIVCCKDCLHWDDHVEECSNPDSICFRNGWTKPEWFCADGERKE